MTLTGPRSRPCASTARSSPVLICECVVSMTHRVEPRHLIRTAGDAHKVVTLVASFGQPRSGAQRTGSNGPVEIRRETQPCADHTNCGWICSHFARRLKAIRLHKLVTPPFSAPFLPATQSRSSFPPGGSFEKFCGTTVFRPLLAHEIYPSEIRSAHKPRPGVPVLKMRRRADVILGDETSSCLSQSRISAQDARARKVST